MKFISDVKAGRLETKDARSAYFPALGPQKVGKPYKDDWDLDRVIKDAVKKVVPVFRAVHVIADTQARLPALVRQDNRETGAPIEDHPLVRILNHRPNPDENAYVFRYRLSAQVLLSRKGAFVEIIRDRLGDIRYLYLLDPRRTTPVPSVRLATTGMVRGEPVRLVDHYQVDHGRGQVDQLAPEDVAWVRLPHPVDPLAGMTPLEAAGLAIDIDVLARLYNRTFLQNDGRPGGIVGVKGDMDEEVEEELDARFNVGTRGAGRITIVEADGLDWVDTAVSPRDAQYVEALANTKVDILGAFGVPESLAYGNASQRTYDNAEAERSLLWEAAELGHLALLGAGLDEIDGREDTFTGFDLSGVEVLQRADKARREEMRAEVTAGTRTLDSYLEETGRDPVGSEEARAYWRPMGEVPYAIDGQSTPPLSLVQAAAEAGAKAALEALEKKEGVVTPFRYHPPRGA